MLDIATLEELPLDYRKGLSGPHLWERLGVGAAESVDRIGCQRNSSF